jgi:transcriptional regulator with XRE-family HTH domain
VRGRKKGVPFKDRRSDFTPRPYNEAMRQARLAAGFTLAKLGRRTGLSTPMVFQIETFGAYPLPKAQKRIAAALGLSPDALFAPWQAVMTWRATTAIELYDQKHPTVSLDELKPRQFLSADPAAMAEDLVQHQMLKALLTQMLMRLQSKQRRVLQLRFGLIDSRQRTLEEVGKRLGLSRERIRQIENRGLIYLLLQPEAHVLRDFVRLPDLATVSPKLTQVVAWSPKPIEPLQELLMPVNPPPQICHVWGPRSSRPGMSPELVIPAGIPPPRRLVIPAAIHIQHHWQPRLSPIPHKTKLKSVGAVWYVTCTCGWFSFNWADHDQAKEDAAGHVATTELLKNA